jgi:flavin-dependent dehydrogenase
MTVHRATHDVVIVGARAAGSALARLLAQRGHDVGLVDRADLPSDTVSTHQIARTGVVALRRWGLLKEVLASGAPALREVTFHNPDGSTTRPVRASSGVDYLVAPRRYALDAILAEAAVRAGATLRTGVSIAGVHLDDSRRATGVYGRDRAGRPVEISARLVIGADGLQSRVARAVGAELTEQRPFGGSARYAYYADLPWSGIEFYTAPRVLAGIFPTNDGEACVWICAPATADRPEFEAQLAQSVPELARRLAAGRRTSPVSGMIRSPNHLRRAAGPGWALVGDAGFHRDPISAHGISDAFRDAELLAAALDAVLGERADEADALAGYEAKRDAALREIFDLTCSLGAYPPVPAFVEQMRLLGRAIDVEAAALAAHPVLTGV